MQLLIRHRIHPMGPRLLLSCLCHINTSGFSAYGKLPLLLSVLIISSIIYGVNQIFLQEVKIFVRHGNK